MGDMGDVFGSFFGGMGGIPGVQVNFGNARNQPPKQIENLTTCATTSIATLGWRETVDFDMGLKETIEWIKDNPGYFE